MSEQMQQDQATYFRYLDKLRDSATINMFGATPYLRMRFPELDTRQARKVLMDWMEAKEAAEARR